MNDAVRKAEVLIEALGYRSLQYTHRPVGPFHVLIGPNASGKTTLDVYGHLWPDRDESSRAAVAAVYAKRNDPAAESLRNRS